MPYVNIQVTDEGVTADERRQLIEGVTELLERVLRKPPSTTYVVIQEIALDAWGVGGKTVAELKAQGKHGKR
jgi:4-oxalocrotonate tautomerase family enzyme